MTVEEVKRKNIEAAMTLPLETRQRFLDLMWASKTLGEAQRTCDITFDQAMGLMDMNIKSASFLNRRAE